MSYACLFHEKNILYQHSRDESTEQKIRDSPFPRGILEAPRGHSSKNFMAYFFLLLSSMEQGSTLKRK